MKIWNVVCAGLLLAGTGVFAEEVLVSRESSTCAPPAYGASGISHRDGDKPLYLIE